MDEELKLIFSYGLKVFEYGTGKFIRYRQIKDLNEY